MHTHNLEHDKQTINVSCINGIHVDIPQASSTILTGWDQPFSLTICQLRFWTLYVILYRHFREEEPSNGEAKKFIQSHRANSNRSSI